MQIYTQKLCECVSVLQLHQEFNTITVDVGEALERSMSSWKEPKTIHVK